MEFYYIQTQSHTNLYINTDYKYPQSLTVSFLQDSCGFSLESAVSYSKKLNIENVKNPNSILDLLRNHGLTQTHIGNLIRIRPLLLSADLDNTLMPNMEVFESLGFSGSSLAKMLSKHPAVLESDAHAAVEFFRAHGFSDKQITTLTMKRPSLYLYNADKIFKPKLEFFKSLGFSDFEIAKLLSSEPYILTRSLENHIIPCVQMLRRVLGIDENVLKATACYQIFESNKIHMLHPNIDTLKSHGSLLICSNRFSEIVSEVMKLGFDPNCRQFVLAIRSMAQNTKKLWGQKVEAFRSFGLSEDEIYAAFKRQPMCMSCSEKKIKKMMGFFVNKLKMKPSMISKSPNLLLLSLEKRVIPRCSVMQVLMLKGLMKDDIGIVYMVTMAEKKFMVRFVSKYQNEVPVVVRAHQGKIEFQGLPIAMKM
ncbi:hypothetical protein CIPAW_12G037700 [Carya illinoinensis]|uniref:Uncharacterized protein n=1 Tax=Carya illinoinensis TaxID=32201 RepID=A0A8T1NMM8_CARIL|nr:hypothetical protein CIPAW_12G037700 [Carya illinoinensis]